MNDKPIIKLKINCSKIVKERLFKGEKGTYLDATLVPVSNSQYGDDYMITQDVSKEEREQGVKGAILGNAKILERRGVERKPITTKPNEPTVAGDGPVEADDSIPF
jgi:hypothetical protein